MCKLHLFLWSYLSLHHKYPAQMSFTDFPNWSTIQPISSDHTLGNSNYRTYFGNARSRLNTKATVHAKVNSLKTPTIESYQCMVKKRSRKISSCSSHHHCLHCVAAQAGKTTVIWIVEVMENIMKPLTELQKPSICRGGRICWRENHSYSSINQNLMAQWPNRSNSWVKGTAQSP